MSKFFTSLLLIIACYGAPAIAGPGHDHNHGHSHGPISAEKAGKKAIEKVAQLVDRKKIDSSWAKIKPTSIEKKEYAKGPEWVVTFNNPKISNPEKQTLYLFYSLDGHYIATNYTGN